MTQIAGWLSWIAGWLSSHTGGPLSGVVIGAGLTWLIQRNEWGRQRRWELRRDATLDAIRGLADLEDAVTNLDSVFTQPEGTLTEEARTAQQNLQFDAMLQFRKRCSAYKRAHIIADLAVGGNLSGNLSKYFQFALPLAGQGFNNRKTFLNSAAKKKELALRGNAVIMSAREALGIKNASDLPLLDESN
jgi:hypothetical protein